MRRFLVGSLVFVAACGSAASDSGESSAPTTEAVTDPADGPAPGSGSVTPGSGAATTPPSTAAAPSSMPPTTASIEEAALPNIVEPVLSADSATEGFGLRSSRPDLSQPVVEGPTIELVGRPTQIERYHESIVAVLGTTEPPVLARIELATGVELWRTELDDSGPLRIVGDELWVGPESFDAATGAALDTWDRVEPQVTVVPDTPYALAPGRTLLDIADRLVVVDGTSGGERGAYPTDRHLYHADGSELVEWSLATGEPTGRRIHSPLPAEGDGVITVLPDGVLMVVRSGMSYHTDDGNEVWFEDLSFSTADALPTLTTVSEREAIVRIGYESSNNFINASVDGLRPRMLSEPNEWMELISVGAEDPLYEVRELDSGTITYFDLWGDEVCEADGDHALLTRFGFLTDTGSMVESATCTERWTMPLDGRTFDAFDRGLLVYDGTPDADGPVNATIHTSIDPTG